jgi:pre-mRNA cleavage complex 2 protein Pcf11
MLSSAENGVLIMHRPRLHLISKLYEAVPNQCVTCGRRFESTPEGREKKARHMDWHFKVKDPDAAKRGIHRSWYISEKVSQAMLII